MKLYLVRHGQKGSGDKYDSLTELGKEQARRVGIYLKGKKIDAVFCSTNNRTKDTLNIIAPYINKKIKIEYSDLIRQAGIPSEVGTEILRDNESSKSILDRVKKFWEQVVKEHKEDCVLVVSHKIIILSLICHMLKIPQSEAVYARGLPVASVSYFEFDENMNIINYSIGELKHLFNH